MRTLRASNESASVYPWNASSPVSSHNDPNPRNIIFDGERLWLIDWETAFRNDPLTDVAILAENFAGTPELEDALLQGWLERPADQELRARLLLMRQLTRIYYGAILLSAFAASPRAVPDGDLAAPTPDGFRASIAEGRLKAASPETMYTLGQDVACRIPEWTQHAGVRASIERVSKLMAKLPDRPKAWNKQPEESLVLLKKELRRRGMTDSEIENTLRKKSRRRVLEFNVVKAPHLMPHAINSPVSKPKQGRAKNERDGKRSFGRRESCAPFISQQGV